MTEGRDHWWHELATDESDCPPEPMDAEDLLYLLYTSGTTAKPKGIAHTTAGYLVGVATTHHYIFDLKPERDVYWCAADVGWVTGHSYIVYGPLCNGATSVMYEGTPDFPRQGPLVGDRRALRRDDPLHGADRDPHAHEVGPGVRGEAHDLSSLRLLGSVGEPINPEAWIWYHEHIGGGRCPIVDTWWQTETGMILITPLPGITTTKPGSATRPFPGVDAAVYNEAGDEVGPGRRRLPRAAPAVAGDAARDLRRRRPLPRDVLVEVRRRLLRGRRRPDRRRRRLLAARPRRRRDERLRAPDLDDRGRVGARRPPRGRRGGRRRAQRRDDRPGDRRVRDAQGRRRGLGREARGAARTTWRRRSARSRSRRTSSSRPSCRRPAAARSCGGSCATWPRTGRSATRRRWPTRPWSRSCASAAPRRPRKDDAAAASATADGRRATGSSPLARAALAAAARSPRAARRRQIGSGRALDPADAAASRPISVPATLFRLPT